MEEYIELYRSLEQEGGLIRHMEALEQAIGTAEKKRQKLLTFNALGELSDLSLIHI